MALTDECKNRTRKTETTVDFVKLNRNHFCQVHTPTCVFAVGHQAAGHDPNALVFFTKGVVVNRAENAAVFSSLDVLLFC